MFKTYYPSLVDQSAVPIQKGGTDGVTAIEATDNLSMVTDIMNNKPNGWLAMPAGGIVDPSRLPLGMQSKKVTIDGPLTLVGGTPTDYLITNFDSFDQYVFTDVDGTISRTDDIITFIPLISGGVLGYTVNGWRYEFDVTPVTVNKPIIDGLENSTDLGPYQSFTSSPFSVDGGTGTHVSSDWQISESNSFSSILPSSVNASAANKTSFEVSDLPANKSLFIRVRYNSQIHGVSAWSDPVSFSTRMSYLPETPSITFPVNNATGISSSITVTSTAYVGHGTTATGMDTMTSAQWEYSADNTFPGASTTSVIKLVDNNPTNLAITGLTANISYYVRVRYLSSLGGAAFSDWSPTVMFTTAVSFKPGAPSITSPASGAIEQDSNLTITSSAFITTSGDTHQGTSWEVNTNASFSGTSYAAINNSATNKLSLSLVNLPANTTLYARVMHHGVVTGASDWSSPINFRTKTVTINTPTISGSATVSILTPSFTSTAYALSDPAATLDAHLQSNWEVYAVANPSVIVADSQNSVGSKTAFQVGAGLLSYGTAYAIRVKYIGSLYGESAYSTPFNFSISSVTVNTPSVLLAAFGGGGGATVDSITPTFTSSAFAQTPTSGGLIHIQSTWQVSDTSSFTNIMSTNTGFVIGGTNTLTSWTVGTGTVNTPMVAGGSYYVRVKHTGTGNIDSQWSTPQAFTVAGGVNGNLTGVVMVVSPTTIQPLSAYTINVGMTNAPASIGDVTVVIQYLNNTVWTDLPDPIFTKTAGVGTITSGSNRSITYNLTHSAPGVTDTTWILRAKVTQSNLSSNTASSGQTTVILKAAAVNTNWTPTIIGPAGTVALGTVANYNITLNGATVGQTYTYTATANGTNIGSGSIVATAVNNTYSASSISWGVAATNTVASWNIVLSMTNNGTTKTSSATTIAATYTAPVNITSVEFNVAPRSVEPYAIATFYVAINGAPSSLGNVKVQIEGWNGSTWVDSPAEFYLKDATVASIVPGDPSRRYIEFTVVHSLPGTSDLVVPVRARAYQESNPSNLARSSQIDITLKGQGGVAYISGQASVTNATFTGAIGSTVTLNGQVVKQDPSHILFAVSAPHSESYSLMGISSVGASNVVTDPVYNSLFGHARALVPSQGISDNGVWLYQFMAMVVNSNLFNGYGQQTWGIFDALYQSGAYSLQNASIYISQSGAFTVTGIIQYNIGVG